MNALRAMSGSSAPPPSSEETDQLRRSTKRANDLPPSPTLPSPDITMVESSQTPLNPVSYKDMVVENSKQHLLPSFLPNFPSYESDDDYEGDLPFIKLTKADKQRMSAPWLQSIIVKAFGKNVGYKFLFPRVNAQWKPIGKMECVDLGDDYFTFRFENLDDFRRVLTGGPWFVGPHFLTIRKWEPMFSTSGVTTTTTAVWAQLPQLPTDCFDPKILEQIGRILGKPLRVDRHMSTNIRGRFARICIQVDLNKPLVKEFQISNHRQRVQYEGITALCFECGCIGHRATECKSKLPPESPQVLPSIAPDSSSQLPQMQDEQGYGEFLLVESKSSRRRNKKQQSIQGNGGATAPSFSGDGKGVVGSNGNNAVPTDISASRKLNPTEKKNCRLR